ncbi:MAG: sugar transferase [Acidiferrobacterales bacterium]|nr:sugar transferase [Acidiferrobacterales bacterium]
MLIRTLRHEVAVSRKQFAKWAFDVCVSGVLLLLTLPIIILTVILIYVESPGLVFDRRPRIGQYGCRFALLTFRTTCAGTEATLVATAKDAPCTRVGRIIRTLGIDELPQLFNILRGDMSFVGPRAETPAVATAMSRRFARYSERRSVRPGITGCAQIGHLDGNSIMDARGKLEDDLYYVRHHSLPLDLRILVQTARLLLREKGPRRA